MIEFLGMFYEFTKDIKDYLHWDEEVKIVDREWLTKSGFDQVMQDKGYSLYWSKAENVESRKLDGYELIYEVDQFKRVRRRIEWRNSNSCLLLIGKKS